MKIDRNILIRYFSGESSENEKKAIEQWLESDETHKSQFISERIRFDASLIIDEEKITALQTTKINLTKNILKIAAAILLMIGCSYLFSLYNSPQTDVITQTIHVPFSNRISITLPDGTLVWLNSNTTLKYPSAFTDKQRVVELNGEAYFEVTKNKDKAFVVKTNKYNIEVLGTTFDVEAYANKPTFTTTLFTGKIKLYHEDKKQTLVLNEGEVAELIDNDLKVFQNKSNSYRWRDGIIIIEDKSFGEIMELFEKYYGYEIIIKNDKVKERGYQGKLLIADGIDHALRVLQNDFMFSYKRDKDMTRIYIY